MKTLFSLILSAALLPAQNVPVVTGHNPSVQLGTALYNEGTVRVFTGTGAPTAPTLNAGISDIAPVRGDYYFDTSTTPVTVYTCAAATCSTAANWQQAAYPLAVSVTAFGVSGSSSTDAANLQTAITAASGHFCLYIPAGLTVQMANNAVVLYSNTCISGAGPSLSKVAGNGLLATAGVGIFTVYQSASNVSIKEIGFDGGITSPTGVLYSTAGAGGPEQFSNGSTIYVNGGVTGLTISDCTISHTNGYAIYLDTAAYGNTTNVKIRNVTVQNSRPNLFGTSALAELYGSWTGGIYFNSLGAVYNFQNVTVDHCLFQNVTGNALWTHLTNLTVLNQNFSFTNNTCIDTGLDCIQVNGTNGYIETGNRSFRNGFVIVSDVGYSRVGGPMWLQGYPPSAFDGGIGVLNAVRSDNVADGFNGDFIDADGTGLSAIKTNTGVSCFLSEDPLVVASQSQCGPTGNVGLNYMRGITVGNSQNVGNGGRFLTITGNVILGVGNSGIVGYPLIDCIIEGNTIDEFPTIYGNPIVLGNMNFGSHTHSTGNLVSKNNISWSPTSGAPAVFEDGVSGYSEPYVGQDANFVNGNNLSPTYPLSPGSMNMYEFQKAPGSSSGTGNLSLATVTPSATCTIVPPATYCTVPPTSTILQTEGSAGYPYLQIYANSGSGYRLATFSPGGLQLVSVPFNSWSALVNTSYTDVTGSSGAFSLAFPGQVITITSVPYTIATVVNSGHLTLTTSAGVQTGATASAAGLPPASSYPGSMMVCLTCNHGGGVCSAGSSKTLAFSDGTNWNCF